MMGWPNNYVQGVYNSDNELVGVDDGTGGQIGLTPTYTWATKPLASAYTGRAFISDIGGGSIWISNGTRWYPENREVILYTLPAAVSGTYGTVAITAQYLMPAGVFQNGDYLEIISTSSKGGTTTTFSHAIRFGAAGSVADTAINGATTSLPSTTTLMVNGNSRIQRISATNAKYLGAFWNSVGSSTTAIAADTTVDNMDAAFYITRTTSTAGALDTAILHEFTIRLIANL